LEHWIADRGCGVSSSNGNVFPQNAGVKIPLTFGLGYAF